LTRPDAAAARPQACPADAGGACPRAPTRHAETSGNFVDFACGGRRYNDLATIFFSTQARARPRARAPAPVGGAGRRRRVWGRRPPPPPQRAPPPFSALTTTAAKPL